MAETDLSGPLDVTGNVVSAAQISGATAAIGSSGQLAVSSAGNLSTSGQLKSTLSAPSNGLNVAGTAVIAGGFTSTFQAKRAITFTANAYSLVASDSGMILTSHGQGAAFTINLPAVTNMGGFQCRVINSVDQSMTIAAASAILIVDGLTGITTATWATASHQIGSAVDIFCDGTNWYAINVGATAISAHT